MIFKSKYISFSFSLRLSFLFIVFFKIFYINNLYGLAFINPEIGVKHYYSAVEKKDRQDAALYLGLGYVSEQEYTLSLGFTSGSIKREQGVIKCNIYCGDYPVSINFSNSLDLFLGKIFSFDKFYLHLQGGGNFSVIKINDINQQITPEYKILPKAKITIGTHIYKHAYINFNYHHVFSLDKLSINSTAPYNFKGHPHQGILSIGISYFI